MINFINKTISLIGIFSIMFYLFPQQLITHTNCAVFLSKTQLTSTSEPENSPTHLNQSSMRTLQLDSRTLSSTIPPITNAIGDYAIYSSTEQVGIVTSTIAHSSKSGRGIAPSCIDSLNHFYDSCFRNAIVRTPHLAARFAGRNLRVAKTCHTIAVQRFVKCQKQISHIIETIVNWFFWSIKYLIRLTSIFIYFKPF